MSLDRDSHLRRLGLDDVLVVAVWAVLILLLKVAIIGHTHKEKERGVSGP